jgi:hypothetical protein
MARRFTWPWGRVSPQKRMDELDRMILRHQASMRILKAQVEEATRLHQKTIEALNGQKEIVSSFLNENKRKEIMEEAFELESSGIAVLDNISLASSMSEIEGILSLAKTQKIKKNLEEKEEIPTSLTDIDSFNIFNEMDDDIDDIFGKKE